MFSVLDRVPLHTVHRDHQVNQRNGVGMTISSIYGQSGRDRWSARKSSRNKGFIEVGDKSMNRGKKRMI